MTPAFSYDAENKVLVALNSKVSFQQGTGEFQIVINGEYPFSFDEDGLLVGDVTAAMQSTLYPQLNIIQIGRQGLRSHIASITQNGGLITGSVHESDTLPSDSLNLMDLVAFDIGGITTTKVNEVWYLASDGNYVCTQDRLIRVAL